MNKRNGLKPGLRNPGPKFQSSIIPTPCRRYMVYYLFRSSVTMETITRIVRYGAGTILGLTALACVGLYFFQNKLLYMPNPPGFPANPDQNPEGFKSPAEWNTNGSTAESGASNNIPFENAMLTTSDGFKIHTWLLLHPNSRDVPTLIYFHGNAGNMGFRLQNAAKMFAAVGINVLMMDYRGYGHSEGTPDEEGLNIDADTVLKYAKNHPRYDSF